MGTTGLSLAVNVKRVAEPLACNMQSSKAKRFRTRLHPAAGYVSTIMVMGWFDEGGVDEKVYEAWNKPKPLGVR